MVIFYDLKNRKRYELIFLNMQQCVTLFSKHESQALTAAIVCNFLCDRKVELNKQHSYHLITTKLKRAVQ